MKVVPLVLIAALSAPPVLAQTSSEQLFREFQQFVRRQELYEEFKGYQQGVRGSTHDQLFEQFEAYLRGSSTPPPAATPSAPSAQVQPQHKTRVVRRKPAHPTKHAQVRRSSAPGAVHGTLTPPR